MAGDGRRTHPGVRLRLLALCLAATSPVAAADPPDRAAGVAPSTAVEVCNGLDDDGDGAIDTRDPDLDHSTTTLWYADADHDGLGDPAASLPLCGPIAGYVDNAEDPDDTTPAAVVATTEP